MKPSTPPNRLRRLLELLGRTPLLWVESKADFKAHLDALAKLPLYSLDVLWIFVLGKRSFSSVFRLFFFVLISEFLLFNALPGLLLCAYSL